MKKTVFFGLLAIVLTFGMVFVGCESEPTSSNKDEKLPVSSGVNAVSGKAYFEWIDRITFSVTAAGATSGTYTIDTVESGEYGPTDKYKYNTEIETGTYSWNEGTKTLSLKPELIAFSSGGSGDASSGGWEEIENNYGPLGNKKAFRAEIQAMVDEEIKYSGQKEINDELSSMGFSSISSYINYAVNEAFSIRTFTYSFNSSQTVLFLEKELPANRGTNEFSGQTYYGLTWDWVDGEEVRVKDENEKYVFTTTGYTFTSPGETTTGSYTYDSVRKQVCLRPQTINGKNRTAFFEDQTAPAYNKYPDDNSYCASQTNDAFSFWGQHYNSTNKTIGWED